MDKTIWKPVTGFEGIYEISNKGEVKGLERIIEVKGQSNRLIGEKILSPVMYGKYKGVQLCSDGEKHKYYIHRLVASHFSPNENENVLTVNHKDGNKFNNCSENLEWLTHKENLKHAVDIGLRKPFGENSSLCKFSSKVVAEVRNLYDNGIYKQSELASIYGISRMQVHRIVMRKNRTKEGWSFNENVRISN